MKRILAVISLAVFTAFGLTLNAQGNFKKGQKLNAKERLEEKLNLSDEQQDKFNDIRFAHKKEVIDLKAGIEKNRLGIRKMMADNNIDENKLIRLTEENNNLRSKIHTSKVSMWLDIYNILDNSQKETWTENFEKFGRRADFRKKGRQGKGIGPCGGEGRMKYHGQMRRL